MKNTRFRKVLALLLSLIITVSVPLTVANAATAGVPLIIVPDMTDIVIYSNPGTTSRSEVFNVNSQSFLSSAVKVLSGIAALNLEQQKGLNQINTAINEMLGDIVCDGHGNSKNADLGVENIVYRNGKKIIYYASYADSEIYTENVKALVNAAQGIINEKEIFVYQYDWRLNPIDNVASLKEFIEVVKENTGKSKVAVVSGGTGGNVVSAYLYSEASHAAANLSSCVFLDSAANGNSIIGDIMSGHLVHTVKDDLEDISSIGDLIGIYDTITGADLSAAFISYLKQDPGGLLAKVVANLLKDDSYSGTVAWLALQIAGLVAEEAGFLDKLGQGYKKLLVLNKEGFYSGDLTEIMRNMPGIWAMVPAEQYNDAIEFMFGSTDNIDSQLYSKIKSYRNVINNNESTLKKAVSSGINVCIVAGYNMQILPVTASAIYSQSDGLVATRYAGFGATTGDMSSKVTLTKQCQYRNHNHVEPNKMVDASTCYLPESTWFIKGHEHMEYTNATAANFVIWLATGTSQRTVWQNDSYPQYLQTAAVGGKISALSHPTDNEKNDYMVGDLDVDGSITAADARLALRYAVGLEGKPTTNIILIADVDGSGEIDAADARYLLRYAVGLEKSIG